MATDLDRFVAAEGRDALIADVRRRIDAEGITYIYYQFISVTGRIMGKGVPAAHWESMAAKGFQLVYGSTANLFTDRHGEYIGYGPEAAELVGMPEPETFEVLPWDRKVARVWCTCFRNREEHEDPGSFLTSDCRGNLKRIQAEFEAATGLHLRAGTEPEMMWLNLKEDGTPDVSGVTKPYCYHIDQFSRAAADHPQGDRVRAGARARHDPGRPRGRARPDRAQLQLRPRRADRGQPLDVPPDLPAGRPRAERLPVLHAEAVHGRLGQRLPPQHLALARRRERVHAGDGRPAAAEPGRPLGDRRHPRAPRRADGDLVADRELVPPPLGHGLLGAGLRRLGLPEPHDRAARLGPGSVRVPLGRLGRQPVPLDGRADQGHAGRDRAPSSTRASRRSGTSTLRWRPARRSRRSR